MANRSRSGAWWLLGLAALVVAGGWWFARTAFDAPLDFAGRDDAAAVATPAPPKTAGPAAPKAPDVVGDLTSANDERTSFVPPVGDGSQRAPALELDVVDLEGRPIVGAEVRVFTPTKLLGGATSDATGLARVPAGEGAGRALVLAAGGAPWLAELDVSPGRRRIDEPDRPLLHGTLRVDRQEPGRALELELSSDRALFDAAEIPAVVRAALALDARAATRVVTRCDVHGEFALRGLVDPFTGRLTVPEHFAIAKVDAPGTTIDRRDVHFRELVPTVTIELVALPRLVGRVVNADGAPAANADVEGWVEFAGADRGRGGRMVTAGIERARCDADGRFASVVGLPRAVDPATLASADALPAIARVGLSVLRDSHSTPTDVEIRQAAMAGRWDVGEVRLSPAQRYTLVVRAPDQKPLEGAFVLAEDARSETDASGTAVLAHVEDVERALVGKLGWTQTDVALGGEAPIEVMLQPSNRWSLSIVDATGAPIPKRRFTLSAPHALFSGDDPTRPARTLVETGATDADRASRSREDGSATAQFRCDEDGRAVLGGLVAPFTLRVTDGLGAVLEERTVELGAEETREDVVKLGTRGGSFTGRVVDTFGTSLAGANVRLVVRTPRASESQRTDAAGEFRFEDLQGGRARFEIEREGFSPLAIDDYELVLDAEPVEFRLHTAGTLSVEIVDDLGNAVATDDLRVRARQHPNLPVRRRGPNRFELRELPGDPVTLTISIGGRSFERDVDAMGGDTRVVVPRHGRARITFAPRNALLTGGEYRVRLRSTDPSDRASLNAALRTQRSPIAASFDALLPGEYEVFIEWREASDRDGHSVRRIGSAKRFTVEANAAKHVELSD